MKDVNGELRYKDKIIKYVFNLNVMEAIQDEYGTLDEWGALTDGTKGEVNAKAIIFGFTEMINEAVDMKNDDEGTNDPHYTHKQVGRMITEIGIENAAVNMNKTIVDSTRVEPKNE